MWIPRDRSWSFELYGSYLADLRHKKSSSLLDMGPESLLIDDLDRIPKLCLSRCYDSLVLKSIERTGRVEKLSASTQRYQSCNQELGLKSSDLVYIFDVPVAKALLRLKSYALSRAWSVEEDSVKSLWERRKLYSVETRYSNIEHIHPLNIIEERVHAILGKLIGNDEAFREMLSKLSCLASWTCCHFEDEEWLSYSCSVSEDMHCHRGGELLDVEVTLEVFGGGSKRGRGILAVDAEGARIGGRSKYPAILSLARHKLDWVNLVVVEPEGFTKGFKEARCKILDRPSRTSCPRRESTGRIKEGRVYGVDEVEKCHTTIVFEGLFGLLSQAFGP